MKTLVYFASGPIKDKYHDLNFDQIYLIDNCFKNEQKYPKDIFSDGKITCVGMDCLESITFLKAEDVEIDYFVALNEGLYEGGGYYPINSDLFLGYVMPLLKPHYIHIMDKTFYNCNGQRHHVTMDLPYDIVELNENDDRYLNPFIFSNWGGNAKVLQMSKLLATPYEISINPLINVKIIHDSIWNYYEELDEVVFSCASQSQEVFFEKKWLGMIFHTTGVDVDKVLSYCENYKIKKIGFTPWGKRNYKSFINKLKERKSNYPSEILLFHLNKDDYQEFKQLKSNGREG